MIIVEITGGLGNQMFQYALYMKLKKEYPTEQIKLDTHFFEGCQAAGLMEERRLELSTFKLTYETASKWEVRKINGCRFFKPKGMIFNENLDATFEEKYQGLTAAVNQAISQKKDIFISGYWQCEKFFMDIRQEIVSSFSFDEKKMNPECAELARQIQNQNSVAVHIRRGDYTNDHNQRIYGNICTREYYAGAVEYLQNRLDNPSFYFFSNDPEWIRENMEVENMHIVNCNGEASHEYDMYLMTQCRHHIIANSSFSWWGAWLAENDEQIVIAPHRWFNNHEVYGQMCDGWVRM